MAKPPNSALQSADSGVLIEGLLRTGVPETQREASSTTSNVLGAIMPQLYDMESSYSEPEKLLSLDLDLDQIEDCQE